MDGLNTDKGDFVDGASSVDLRVESIVSVFREVGRVIPLMVVPTSVDLLIQSEDGLVALLLTQVGSLELSGSDEDSLLILVHIFQVVLDLREHTNVVRLEAHSNSAVLIVIETGVRWRHQEISIKCNRVVDLSSKVLS